MPPPNTGFLTRHLYARCRPRQGLSLEIPLNARIFDALGSPGPYKDAPPFETAWRIHRDDAGSHFDPTVVDAFRLVARRLHQLLERDIRRYFF